MPDGTRADAERTTGTTHQFNQGDLSTLCIQKLPNGQMCGLRYDQHQLDRADVERTTGEVEGSWEYGRMESDVGTDEEEDRATGYSMPKHTIARTDNGDCRCGGADNDPSHIDEGSGAESTLHCCTINCIRDRSDGGECPHEVANGIITQLRGDLERAMTVVESSRRVVLAADASEEDGEDEATMDAWHAWDKTVRAFYGMTSNA